MCNIKCIEFVQESLKESDVKGKKVLEVGSRNVNGSAREYVESLNPASYLGIDIIEGEGVDEICSVYDLLRKHEYFEFDIIICTEVLEHVLKYDVAIKSMRAVLKVGGIMIVTVPRIGVPYHGYPHDYWRYERSDISYLFRGMQFESFNVSDISLHFKARKMEAYLPSIQHYQLYSIIRGRRTSKMNDVKWLHSFRVLQVKVKKAIRRFIVKVTPRSIKNIFR